MRRAGKWIEGLEATTPVEEAARRVLEVRLAAVVRLLALADKHFEEDVEHVHQLRVATRRAAAAVRVFRPWLRQKSWKKLREGLRRVRRAAGEARDWDVFADLLREQSRVAPRGSLVGVEFLLGYAARKRAEAQAAIRACRRQGVKLDRATKLQKGLGARRSAHTAYPQLIDTARDTLSPLVAKLRAAGKGNLRGIARLHQLRLAAKRLRYALEIFIPCLGSTARGRLYPTLEELQEHLGRINDRHQAVGRIGKVLSKLDQLREADDPPVETLRRAVAAAGAAHTRQELRRRKEFLRWWSVRVRREFFDAFERLMDRGGRGRSAQRRA